MWRGRKTGRWEGHGLSSVSGVLENNGTSSDNPSCTRTHTHTLLDSTLWICSWPFRPHPFHTCQRTSLRRMRAPAHLAMFSLLTFLGLSHPYYETGDNKRPQSRAFSFHRSPLHQRECRSLIFPNFQSLLASLFSSYPFSSMGVFYQTMSIPN